MKKPLQPKTFKNILLSFIFIMSLSTTSNAATYTLTLLGPANTAPSTLTVTVGDIIVFTNWSTPAMTSFLANASAFNMTTAGGTYNYTVVPADVPQIVVKNGTQTVNYITITVQAATGLREFTNAPSLKLFPNPVTDILNVTSDAKTQINIFNTIGQSVLKQDIEIGNNNVELRYLPSGVYYVLMENKRIKVVKE